MLSNAHLLLLLGHFVLDVCANVIRHNPRSTSANNITVSQNNVKDKVPTRILRQRRFHSRIVSLRFC